MLLLNIPCSKLFISDCLISSAGEIISHTAKGFSVYPNPSSGIFYFHNSTNEQIEKTEVFNYTGERIFYKEGNTKELNLTQSAGGIYFYKIKTREVKERQGKIVKG